MFAIVLCACGQKDAGDVKASSPPAEAPKQSPPAERPPSFTAKPSDEAGRAHADAAMRAVYARCSQFPAFREGSALEADYVPAMGKYKAMSNVSVTLADPGKAQGNTLWYQVTFAGDTPATITPNKRISATLCGFSDADKPVQL